MGQSTSSQQHRRASLLKGRQDSPEASHEFRMPYVLQATLGNGKNGVIYVAELTSGEVPGSSGRNIVVKKVPLSHKKKRSKLQTYELRDEIDALVELEHANLVKYFGWNIEAPNEDVVDQHVAYFRIFMEYCTGGTLQQRARKGLRYHQLRDCTRQILEGLSYLHAAGIVHGDLNSTSILLTDRSQLHLKIGGFGNKLDLTAKSSGRVASSGNGYNAPETCRKPSVKGDPKSDIWNVAFVLIELLHEGEREEFASTEALLELFGGSLDSIIMWFLGADALLGSAYLAYFTHNRKVIECIKFLKACLQLNPSDRPTAAELLKSPHVSENLDEKEVRLEEEVLKQFTVINVLTEWLYQAVDTRTGERVILTKRTVELANWMDEFVSLATVVASHGQFRQISHHPQMITRTDCWACREGSLSAFVEQMTIYSRWDHRDPCVLLEKIISSSEGGLPLEQVKAYASQVLAMLLPIWHDIEACSVGASVVVLDLCAAYLLVNENRRKVMMLPFLLPEVITSNDTKDCFISANIWDLGIVVLSMVTGKLILEGREAGSFSPAIPEDLAGDTGDFIASCFNCFAPLAQEKSKSWIREPGQLVWTVEQLTAHAFFQTK